MYFYKGVQKCVCVLIFTISSLIVIIIIGVSIDSVCTPITIGVNSYTRKKPPHVDDHDLDINNSTIELLQATLQILLSNSIIFDIVQKYRLNESICFKIINHTLLFLSNEFKDFNEYKNDFKNYIKHERISNITYENVSEQYRDFFIALIRRIDQEIHDFEFFKSLTCDEVTCDEISSLFKINFAFVWMIKGNRINTARSKHFNIIPDVYLLENKLKDNIKYIFAKAYEESKTKMKSTSKLKIYKYPQYIPLICKDKTHQNIEALSTNKYYDYYEMKYELIGFLSYNPVIFQVFNCYIKKEELWYKYNKFEAILLQKDLFSNITDADNKIIILFFELHNVKNENT